MPGVYLQVTINECIKKKKRLYAISNDFLIGSAKPA
jgi:hypothetical protein